MNMCWQFTLILCLSTWITFIHGSPITFTTTPTSSEIKSDMEMALDVAQITSAAVNNTLLIYCDNTPLMFAPSCRLFINMILKKIDATFPQMYIQNNITITQTELLKMALFNMSTTLGKYIVLIKHQVKREYDSLCAPVERIGAPCNYPAACSKLTPESNAVFYCYLRQTVSYLVDMELLLNLPISSNFRDNVKVDDSLLVPNDIPITESRWFTMVTLHTLLEHMNSINHTLQSCVWTI